MSASGGGFWREAEGWQPVSTGQDAPDPRTFGRFSAISGLVLMLSMEFFLVFHNVWISPIIIFKLRLIFLVG